MADRTSAELFGMFFDELAKLKDERLSADEYVQRVSRKLYKLTFNYDFNQYQMDADDALVALGLAKKMESGETHYLDSAMKEYKR